MSLCPETAGGDSVTCVDGLNSPTTTPASAPSVTRIR